LNTSQDTTARGPARGKQFRLVKFFAAASFVVLVIFSFPFSVVISQKAKDLLMESHEKYALLLGENLNHQVFRNFVLPVTRRYGRVKLREDEQYVWMDRIVRNTVHSLNIELVNVYDINKGVIAYSTDPDLLGKKAKRTEGYLKAVKGEHTSGLLRKGEELWGLGIERLGGEKKLRTYIPFRGADLFTGDKGYVLGVFELIQDLSDEYESIVKLQYLIFGLSILIMGSIFVALILIVHKAERIIDERARKQRDLESQLHQAERLAALGQMCAGVSHEIRNPLGIIRSTAELLGNTSGSDDSHKRLSGVIIEESSRLDNIVTEFLDFARPQEPNFQDCYLEEIIHKNLDFLQPELEKSNIAIDHNLNGRSFHLKADPQLLYRGFLNIFVNAVQAMHNGGTITTEIADRGSRYTVMVKDTGEGISQEDLNKILDPFFSTKDKGSGLGLSIVRNIIEAHSGTLKIRSEKGKGTTVIIELPKTN